MKRILLAALLACAALPAWAQGAYPNRPIRWIVGFGAGGVGDMTARLVGQKLSEGLGQPVVVENRPSAGGIVATETVARAAPDGHTLLLVTATAATAPHLFSTLPYHPINDFEFVSQIASFPHIIVTGANAPYRSLQDLMAASRATPGQVNLGSVSVGTALHLSLALFQSMGNLPVEIVTYRTTGDLLNATATGDIGGAMEVAATTLGQISGGRLRALAVTSPRRIDVLPGVPTVAESGLPDYTVMTWNGMAAPRGTPRPVVDRLNAELRRVLALPEIRDRLLPLAVVPTPTTPEAMRQLLVDETALWGRVITAAKIERR
ncbi:Bug family tripartite tricarboxylate transporter substrate binding protein [Falsiroseomonas selenitidurans]|uniref:Tripartite tricarboxylate transporter substrate binding protein n=1 Tax=Falsiroseomonas selenitidurans TaxID=2716335 RepID=A0ABX1E107_9PROT|nr:tripartite tricarboxylate transporter substrate binding protein [Falsiroseomonas selenitidurans]NKC30791.1 tripartite tricarboxylate transporter substrate binding protein [Falsiroseomonas selenitidurans]